MLTDSLQGTMPTHFNDVGAVDFVGEKIWVG